MSQSTPTSPLSVASGSGLQSEHTRFVHFVNAVLCEDGEILPQTSLWVDTETGTIVSESDVDSQDLAVVDLNGLVLSPGFLDVQINGAYGFDFSDAHYQDGSDSAYRAGHDYFAKQMLRHGVTSYCPTLPSTFENVYHRVLPLLKPERTAQQAENLGIHLEGPFLSRKKPGVHPLDAICNPTKGMYTLEEMYGPEGLANAKLVTLAPDNEGALTTIQQLRERGLVISMGHTPATYAHARAGAQAGATMITHLYNAMLEPHHREPGLFGLIATVEQSEVQDSVVGRDTAAASNNVMQALPHKRPFWSVIADGIHVHPASVRTAYKAFPEGCCLVTDAMLPMGLPSGTYKWSTQVISKQGLELRLKDNPETIAGSAVELDIALRFLITWCSISLAKGLQTCTSTPARAVEVYPRKGSLQIGADADLTVLTATGHVSQVYKLGRRVYEARSKTN